MKTYIVSEDYLIDIANAIRDKTGASDMMTINEMPQKIIDISGANLDNVNVTAADVLAPKVFVDKDGNEQFGTMPTNSLATPSVEFNNGVFTSTVTQEAGYVAEATSSNSLTLPDSWAELNFKIVGGTTQPSGGGGDTLTWDGNTEGLVNISGTYFNVSTACPTLEELQNGGTITLLSIDDEEQTITFTKDSVAEQDGALSIQDENGLYVMVVPENIAPLAGFEAGLYFMDGRSMSFPRITSLTIPGYTGFGGGAPIKENTIWVDTDTKITGWEFSATEPAGVEGLVWISTGARSLTPFNALKKNNLTVYPLKCVQFVSGAWVGKEATIYQGGAWATLWNGKLYDSGDEYELITGGFFKSKENSIGTRTFTKNTDNLYFKSAGTSSGGANFTVSTVEKIDLSSFSTLYARIKHTVSKSTSFYLAAHTVNDVYTYDVPCVFKQSSSFEGVISLDISEITGEHYVLLGIVGNAASNSGNCYVYEVYLK